MFYSSRGVDDETSRTLKGSTFDTFPVAVFKIGFIIRISVSIGDNVSRTSVTRSICNGGHFVRYGE